MTTSLSETFEWDVKQQKNGLDSDDSKEVGLGFYFKVLWHMISCARGGHTENALFLLKFSKSS